MCRSLFGARAFVFYIGDATTVHAQDLHVEGMCLHCLRIRSLFCESFFPLSEDSRAHSISLAASPQRHSTMFKFWNLTFGALAAITLVPSSTQTLTQNVDTTVLSASGNALTPPSQAIALSLLNSSAASLNLSLGEQYHCVPSLGLGLVPASCQDIVPNSLLNPLDDTPKTWGPRQSRVSFDFPMPQRFVSCGYLTIRNLRMTLLI